LDTGTLVETTLVQDLSKEYDGLAFDASGLIVYTAENVAQLRRFDPNGVPPSATDTFLASTGQTPKDLALQPAGVAPSGGGMLVAEHNQARIGRFDFLATTYGAFASYQGSSPDGIAYDALGNLFGNLGVADAVNPANPLNCPNPGEERVSQLDTSTGAVITSSACIPGGLDGLVYDPFSNFLYATTFSGGHIWRFDPTTLLATDLGFHGVGLDGLDSDKAGLLYFVSRNDAAPDTNEVRVFNIGLGTSALVKVVPGADHVIVAPGTITQTAIPEPTSLLLLGGGLVGLARYGARRRKKDTN
jgi:sugar lactone lactonase YvrE